MFTEQATDEEVVKLILCELRRAREKHPKWPQDFVHASAVVAEECGELTRAALKTHYEGERPVEMINEAIQTAAMCIRFCRRQ